MRDSATRVDVFRWKTLRTLRRAQGERIRKGEERRALRAHVFLVPVRVEPVETLFTLYRGEKALRRTQGERMGRGGKTCAPRTTATFLLPLLSFPFALSLSKRSSLFGA